MNSELVRLKILGQLSYIALASVVTGMMVGMIKSQNEQGVLAFFTAGTATITGVVALWANPGQKHDQINLQEGGLQVNQSLEKSKDTYSQTK